MAKEVNKKENKEEKVAKKGSNNLRSELKKVTWPTGKELVNSTIAVIVIVVITAIIVFFLDVVFESLNTYGINKLRKNVSEIVNTKNTETQDAVEENVTTPDTNEVVEGENEVTAEAENTTAEVEDTTAEAPTTEE